MINIINIIVTITIKIFETIIILLYSSPKYFSLGVIEEDFYFNRTTIVITRSKMQNVTVRSPIETGL